jgi:hypothetical protein
VALKTLQHDEPSVSAPVAGGGALAHSTARALIWRYRWALGAAATAVVALAIVRWANTRPGFDPYGWLTWGQQTLTLKLDTNAAPSWKPLPYLFTVPYALFGHFQLWLWMITSVAIAISAMVFAARIVYRVVDPPAGRRWAALVAAALAGLAVNLITQRAPTYSVWHYILSDQSDPMIVALCLGAIDCHLNRRYRWTLVLGVLAGLGRPEVWAILGPWGLWAWRARPQLRPWLVGGVLAILAFWFGVPAISSRSPFVSADNAFYSGRRLKSNQVFGTIGRFLDLMPRGLEITALVSVVLAALRRDLVTLFMAAAVVVWMVVEVAMVLHGWPGVPRYMFEPAGLLAPIAGIGIARVLLAAPRLRSAAGLIGAGLAVVAVASVIPTGVSDARAEHRDLTGQRLRTHTLNLLNSEIAGLGGASRFHPCGEPLTRLQYQSAVAWALHLNVASVGFKYGPAIASSRPVVLFTPYPQSGSGWQIQALHQRLASCRTLPH